MKILQILFLLWTALGTLVSAQARPDPDETGYRIWHGYQNMYYYYAYLLDYHGSAKTTNPADERTIAPGIDTDKETKLNGRVANLQEFMKYIWGGPVISGREKKNFDRLSTDPMPDIDENARIMYGGTKNYAMTRREEYIKRVIPGVKVSTDGDAMFRTMIAEINRKVKHVAGRSSFGSDANQVARFKQAEYAVRTVTDLRFQSFTNWFKEWAVPDPEDLEKGKGKQVLEDNHTTLKYKPGTKGFVIRGNRDVLSIQDTKWGGADSLKDPAGLQALQNIMKAYEKDSNKNYVHRKIFVRFKKIANWMGEKRCH